MAAANIWTVQTLLSWRMTHSHRNQWDNKCSTLLKGCQMLVVFPANSLKGSDLFEIKIMCLVFWVIYPFWSWEVEINRTVTMNHRACWRNYFLSNCTVSQHRTYPTKDQWLVVVIHQCFPLLSTLPSDMFCTVHFNKGGKKKINGSAQRWVSLDPS